MLEFQRRFTADEKVTVLIILIVVFPDFFCFRLPDPLRYLRFTFSPREPFLEIVPGVSYL